jgi:hypothetical protein
MGRTAVGVVTAACVGRTALCVGGTVVGVVTATSTEEEVNDAPVRANKEPINTTPTRPTMIREIRSRPVICKVGFVLSASPGACSYLSKLFI